MTQDDYDKALTIGFILGVQMMEALYGLEQSPESYTKIQEQLREVAEGKVTLGRTPAELRLKIPELDPKKLELHRQSSVDQNQKQAQAILRVFAKKSN